MEGSVLLGEESDEPISFGDFMSGYADDIPLNHPLWPIRAKIARSDYHLNILGEKIRAFLDREPQTFSAESDDETREYVWRVSVRESPDPRWGLLISEIVHHLNSSLDHLVWLIASLHNPGDAPRDTGFPIAKGVGDFRRMWTRSSGYYRVRALPVHAQAIIEDEQPYHRGNAFEGHPLWVLRRLANTDKHETLVTVGGASGQGSADVTQEGGEVRVAPVRFINGPLEDGGVVARWPLPPPGPAGMKIQLNVRFAPLVAFPESGPGKGREVMRTLLELRNRVNEIQNRLAPFAFGDGSWTEQG
jgi:hypothetical protein